MFIAEIKSLTFIKNDEKHTVAYDRNATEWLTQWTPRGNFKMSIASTFEEAKQKLFEMEIKPLFKTVSANRMMGYKAEDFYFMISHNEFKIGCNFWPPNGSFCDKYSCATGDKI